MKPSYIFIVHETEGGHIVRAFTKEEDARNYLNWEVANGKLSEQWYKISKIILEDWK